MSLIGKSIGNYQIKAKLGEGGMGTVYLGEHPLIGKRVAVKVLLEELSSKEDIVSRFFNEAKAVNDIGHQNIVDIVDFGKMKDDFGRDIVYFIMEFLDGESLAARLRRTGLTFKETMHVMEQSLLGAVGVARQGHRPSRLQARESSISARAAATRTSSSCSTSASPSSPATAVSRTRRAPASSSARRRT